MKKQKKIALASILAALCVIILFLGSVFQTLDLSAAAVASTVIMTAFIEIGAGHAVGVYLVSSVISLLILPQKSAAVVFAVFLGYYPIIKAPLNKIRPYWLSMGVKLIIFNIIAVGGYLLATRVFAVEVELPYIETILLAMANIVFTVYDVALERLSVTYFQKIRPKIFGKRS